MHNKHKLLRLAEPVYICKTSPRIA